AAYREQLPFDLMRGRGFSGTGDTGKPYDCGFVAIGGFALCARYQRWMPDKSLFIHGKRCLEIKASFYAHRGGGCSHRGDFLLFRRWVLLCAPEPKALLPIQK